MFHVSWCLSYLIAYEGSKVVKLLLLHERGFSFLIYLLADEHETWYNGGF